MNEYADSLFTMGEELLWLSRVLPELAAGNAAPFQSHNTTQRRLIRDNSAQIGQLCGMFVDACQTAQHAVLISLQYTEEFLFQTARSSCR